jgi:Holliday junction resolvase RusA-like endonuclease
VKPWDGHEVLTIVVWDEPQPQGSKKGFPVRRANGKVGVSIVNDNPEKLRNWRTSVRDAAVKAREAQKWQELVFPLDCPVGMTVTFTRTKPKSRPKLKRSWPDSRPDLEKLTRSVCDALKAAGVYTDDSRVVEQHTWKDWPLANQREDPDKDRLPSQGAVIRVWRVAEDAGAEN